MVRSWPTAKLGEVIDLFDSQRVPLNSRQRQERQGKYPYYGAQGVIDHIDDYIFDGRYILVAEDGENLNSKKLPLALFASGKFWVNNHAHILRGKVGIVDDAFLLACLNNADIKPFITGAAQPKLSQGNLRLLEIPLPPLPIQQRIAGILSAYNDLIENSQRRIQVSEAMARNLYREWFINFRFPGCESSLRASSQVGSVPKGWEKIPFESLLASMTGGDWGSEQPEGRDSAGVIVVRGTDFDDISYGAPLRAPIRYITPSSFASRGLRAGDVVIENSINAKSRSVGTTLLIDNHVLNRLGNDAIAASFCKVFRPHDRRLAPLVHLHARHLREDARMEYYQNVAANGIANFQARKFAKEEYLVLPTDEEARAKLTAPIVSIFESVGVLASQLANLRRTRDLLAPRLLSGEIDVEAA